MARPQNGVNGSIPQQPYGYFPNTFNINNQVQRNHNQNVYGYSEMPQVVPSHFLSQGYSAPHGHNANTNIRPVAPIIAPQQYTLLQYPPQQSNFQQYSFMHNYPQQQQYMYPIEVQTPSVPVTYPTTTRKLNPLVVVDPINNTDLDLSKFQSQSTIDKKTKGLFDTQKTSQDIKIEETFIEDRKENVSIEITLGYNQCEIVDKIKEIYPSFQCEELKENIKNQDTTNDIHYQETYDSILSDDTEDQIQPEENILEEQNKEESMEEDKDLEIVKIDTLVVRSDIEVDSGIQGINNEDHNLPEKTPLNYYLPIDKKESDETILRRKLIYDREYLISLKSHSQSKKKPVNLPSTSDFSEEIIYSESQNISWTKPESSSTNQQNNDKFTKKQISKYPSNNSRKILKMFQPKLINLDLNDIHVLERSKSSYLPPQLRTKDKEIDPHVELKRYIKCNLNKITPQNFQDCLTEINKLNIKDKDEMSCLISEIFIKAVQEEAYSVTYAQFCNKLASVYSDNHSFKTQLLKKCQDMFQTPIQDQLDNVRTEWVLKIDNEEDPKMKSLYESDIEEQVKKAKDRYFGNIRFIGELFLHQLLAGKVILNCIVELLKGKSETDALLALCKLMETCGKQIDERHKDQMNSFIRNMDDLSKSKELETRIRFKLKDIVDMRQRDWTLRHIQQEKKINPQTMEEQKEEFAAEAAIKLAASQIQNRKSHHNHPNNPVVRRPITSQHRTLALKNLTCGSLHMNEITILGPTSGNWLAGSGSKPKQRDQEVWTPISQKYANNSRSPDLSPQVKMKNRYRTLESSAEGSGADSRSSTPPITHPKNINNIFTSKKKTESMTDNERSDIIFNDLMSTNKFYVENWIQIVNVKPIIEKWIDIMMEKDTFCRRCVGDSFAKLIKDKIMSHDQLIEGTQSFISAVDDLIYDIPKLWDFFAEFLERFICDKNSDISFFQHIFKKLLPDLNVALCLSSALHAASSRHGHNVVGQVFHKSLLKWENFVPNDCNEFVQKNSLQFTIAGGAPLSQSGGHSLQSITDDLVKMLTENVSNEDIFDYLERKIDKPTWKSSECTRTITSCILKAMKRTPKSNVRKYLNDKSEIIKQFSQNKLPNEIEVLRSVLSIADQLDNEILTIIYDVIMTGNIVSNEAFDEYLANSSFKSESNFQLTYQIISQLWSLGTHHR